MQNAETVLSVLREHGIVTGEPGDQKWSRRVREGVSDKARQATRRGPTSADPTGDKARAVKARYRGVCRGCGAATARRNGNGDASAYCKRCHPGAIAPQWTRERVRRAMCATMSRATQARQSGAWPRTPDLAPSAHVRVGATAIGPGERPLTLVA